MVYSDHNPILIIFCRLFLQEIIEIAADEMLHGGTYILLTETVEEENKIKERVNSAIERFDFVVEHKLLTQYNLH